LLRANGRERVVNDRFILAKRITAGGAEGKVLLEPVLLFLA
jgi:hypothetical protein